MNSARLVVWACFGLCSACVVADADPDAYSRCFGRPDCTDASAPARDAATDAAVTPEPDAGSSEPPAGGDRAGSGGAGGREAAGPEAGSAGSGPADPRDEPEPPAQAAGSAAPGGQGAEEEDAGADSGSLPTELPPDPALWLAADRGVSADANGVITRWADQSGHALDATPSAAAAAPHLRPDANGVNRVFFDGNNELALPPFPVLTELSFFAVVNPWSVTACRSVLHLYVPDASPESTTQLNDIEFGFHESQWYYEVGRDFIPRGDPLPVPLPVMTPLLLTTSHAPSTIATTRLAGEQLDSQPIPQPSAVDRTSVFIGNNYYFIDATRPECGRLFGEVSELILYARALEDADRDRVERYLAQKWSLALP